jgi:hypothetical protein
VLKNIIHIGRNDGHQTRKKKDPIIMLDNAHWRLNGCCGTEEKVFLICYALYWFITLALWRTQVLKPLKLLAVLVHELGHASAAWLTCGKVKSISVNENESGLASYSGGVQVCVFTVGEREKKSGLHDRH